MKKARKGKVGAVIALVAALSCSSAVAITQLCLNEESGVISAYAETTTDITTQTYTAEEIASLWSSAVQESIDTGKQVTFTLPADWTAASDTTYTTAFGLGVGFDRGRIYVPTDANIVLDLNGHTIDRALETSISYSNVIYIESSGTLEICDSSKNGTGVITGAYGHTITSHGAGAIYCEGGYLTLNGGSISGNTGRHGGGVYVYTGEFTMNGGEISNNNAADGYGGGVCIFDCTFEMNGGAISSNTAKDSAGGVLINGSSEFTMNGGEISGNDASESGGGGVENDSTFIMNGGIISGNTAPACAGVYNRGIFEMNGGEITGNIAGEAGGGVVDELEFDFSGGIIYGNYTENGEKSNLITENLVFIAGKLSEGAFISFDTSYVTRGQITSGYTSSGNNASKFASYFACDTDDHTVELSGSEIYIVGVSTPVVKDNVDWSFTSSGATVTPEDGKYSQSVTYTGEPFVFDAITDGTATAVDEKGKPITNFVNVGTYFLNVKPANAANYENPFFIFEILPADISEENVTIKTDPVTYTGEELSTSVKVFLNGVLLEENKDYELSYDNNVNAGEGTVIISALGNYTGSVEGTFEIQKAKLGVRYGILSLTYNGGVQGIEVFPEGLKGDDEVNLTVKYYLEDGVTECDPEDVGKYVARITLEDDNYELSRRYETYFTIGSKKVDVIWSNSEFEYDGTAHGLTAYFVDGEGNQVNLTVTMPETTDAGTYTATTALPATGYENYELTESTLSKEYVILQKEVEAVWDEIDLKFDGDEKQVEVALEGLNGADLSADVEYTYYDARGNELTSLPVDAGDYKVVIALKSSSATDKNYKLTGKTEETFTIAKADLEVSLDTNFDGEYDGEGKSPLESVKDELGNELDYTVTYAPVDENGNVIGDYSEELPVNVGKYILKVEVDEANVAQTEYTATFEITAKTVTVEWDFGDTAVEINGVYTYLYNGKAHQPTATAEDMKLTVTGSGKSVGNGYRTVASLDNSNYILDGDLEVSFNVIKSEVASVLWYEFGATEPVADGVKPSYEYISVYGQEGARLSAYGVLKPADASIGWTAADNELITLNVTYPKYSAGYWTELGTYTANATLSSTDMTNDACYMPLGINDEIEFEVTAITHSASVAQIKWVIEVNGKHVVLTEGYEFTYSGDEIAPVAIRILSSAYDPDDLDPDTFEVLNVGGARTDAGTYYAYIIPDPTATYEIKEEDSEFMFVIKPLEIIIAWEDKDEDGNIIFTYNGEEQAPKAYWVDASGNAVLDENGDKIYVDVAGYTDAGTYFAIAETSDNYEITNDNFVEYTIEQLKLSVDDIVWGFETGDEGEIKTGIDGVDYFVWEYDGNEHKPTAKLEVVFVEGADPVEIKLVITGSTSKAGTHYAYVTLDSTDYANSNYKMDIARLKFEIIRDSIEIVWEDANDDGEIIREYDGNEYLPKAYYIDGEGNRVELTVVGSGTNAGNYVACVTDDITASNSKTIVFTIKAKELKVEWDKTTVNYNGTERAPEVTFYETVTGDDGSQTEVEVTLTLGKDYTVSGYTNAGTYTSELNLINVNFKVTDGGISHDFIINKREITVEWLGVDDSDSDFEWKYDGEEHAPKAETSVEGLEITVKGAEVNVGTYTAVAVIDNDNYVISNAKQEFVIKGRVITVIWEGNVIENEDGTTTETFSWQYEGDGATYVPKAYIQLDDGSKGGELEVVGAGIYAGKYTAVALLPTDCEWADEDNSKCEFEVTKKIVYDIIWEFEGATEKVDEDGNTYYEFTYDGEYHKPTAKIASTGEVLTVLGAAVNKGEYTATAILANSDNYEFAKDEDGVVIVESEMRFVILAKTVSVTWKGENDSESDFDWAYDGTVHCPTAWFKDVNDVWVEIPVIGGSASGGEHLAELRDVFDNYDFPEAKFKQPYSITENEVTVEWTDGAEGEDGSITYTYTYNGITQMPEVVAKDADGNVVKLNYVIKCGDETVGAIINAGEYTLTVTPSDKNYKIDSESVNEVKIIVKAMEVSVQWGGKNSEGEIIFTYNGSEQAPKAWFEYEDGNGRQITITLAVEGAGKEVDEYTATVALESDNFVLTGDTQTTFKIVPDTATEWEWDWDANDGLGGWVEVKTETEPEEPVNPPVGGGEGEGETDPTEPEEPANPNPVDPDDGGETDPTDPPAQEGGDADGETSDPENPATPPVSGESGEQTGKDDDDDNGDGTDPEGGNA
ncbi:MAG: MBG domain-containing protein [Clostridia bacterium]|nr:MBG domain-containing protein [Clostridia bacterium]